MAVHGAVFDAGVHRYRRRPRRLGARRQFVGAMATMAACAALLVLSVQAYGGTTTGQEVVVQPGDSLWSIAASHYPGDDTRLRVDELIQVNHLEARSGISAGQGLSLPNP